MVKFGNDPETQTVQEMVQEALDQGLEAAQMVTKDFIFPIKLEFEKGMFESIQLHMEMTAGTCVMLTLLACALYCVASVYFPYLLHSPKKYSARENTT